MALSLAAFDEEVNLLFQGLGIWNLVEGQMPKLQGLKEFTRLFSGLELYDIENIFISENDLSKMNSSLTDLIIQPSPLSKEEMNRLVEQHDRIYCL